MFGVGYIIDFIFFYGNYIDSDYILNHCGFTVGDPYDESCSNMWPLITAESYYVVDMIPFLVMMILHRKSFHLPSTRAQTQ